MIVGQHSRYFDTIKRKLRTAAAVVNGMRTTIIVMEFYRNYALIKDQHLIQERLVCFVTNMEYGTSYQVRIYRRLNVKTEREILLQETGTRQLGTYQIRHRLKKQIRHLINSAPVKFGT